ncbi:hypothetical protein [Aureispira anguillae]|uniref:Lipoprotein n=1 Tax=Aureispira anguillae TaxID=2864201 RepID=A0A915YKH7_9BACT|nr:hypothetical protein [Aureispira anguillae]BDS14689.1 hypothetical protein AsAng_0054700 [Aureispira anguillae]
MKLIFCCLFLLILSFYSCTKKVEGCTHPRAINFNPEADVDEGCDYYELTLEFQHYANSLANDTLVMGNWLTDANNESFYLTTMKVLGGEMHLIKAGTDEVVTSPELTPFYDFNGLAIHVEDNFFISKLGKYDYNIASWTELGEFDRIRFHLGIPDKIRQTSPIKVSENQHPLSTTATTYMFDSTSMSYMTCQIVAKQPHTGNTFTFTFFDYIPIELPYNATVRDGENVPIRLRLDYLALFNGVSFSNDSQATIKNKILQNFPTAYSTY